MTENIYRIVINLELICSFIVLFTWTYTVTQWTVAPPRLLCPWIPPDKNTGEAGVGCHSLQGIFLNPGLLQFGGQIILRSEPLSQALKCIYPSFSIKMGKLWERSRPILSTWGGFVSPGDIQQWLEILLIVTGREWGANCIW